MAQSLGKRLATWRGLSKVQPVQEEVVVDAGRSGENLLRDFVLDRFAYKEAELFSGKRVPGPKGRGKKEIDLIVVTYKCIHVIEAKNWSGELLNINGEWVQKRRSGDQVKHPNLVNYNNEKLVLLQDYLRDKGLQLRPEYFAQKVIFLNNNLQVDDKIAENPDVITMEKLNSYLQQQQQRSTSEKMLGSIVEFCLGSEQARKVAQSAKSLAKSEFDKVLQAMRELPTWDYLVYYGNRVASGDFLRLETAQETLTRKDFSHVNPIYIDWTRSKFAGLVRALFGPSLGKIRMSGQKTVLLTLSDKVVFHGAGESQPQEIPLGQVQQILLGTGPRMS